MGLCYGMLVLPPVSSFQIYNFQVDMSKVKLDVLKPWIGKKITEILGWEDDVVVEFVVNQLEEHKASSQSIFYA